MVPGLEHRRFVSFDGTEIAYQVRGSGPAIVLANGLGGMYEAFRHIYDALGMDYRILCWDYRGLYRSAAPGDPGTLTVPHQCLDLERLLEIEGIDRAVFVGWSMGVQVNFEFYRRHRDRVAGLVAINGTAGRPFDTVLSSRVIRHVIPVALRAVRAQHELVGRATRAAVGWEGLVAMMQRFGLVSHNLDVDAFREVAAGFKDMDWKIYSTFLQRLGEHDASDVLREIDAPTLLITGDRDILTPAFTAEKMHRAVFGSRLVVIEGGTHYTPVEYPRVIQEELRALLARVAGWAPANLDGGGAGGVARGR
jgi:pimeloyl-ACP methyl ester carboxylesterase